MLRQKEGVPGKENSIRNGTEIGKCYGNLKKNEHSRVAGVYRLSCTKVKIIIRKLGYCQTLCQRTYSRQQKPLKVLERGKADQSYYLLTHSLLNCNI